MRVGKSASLSRIVLLTTICGFHLVALSQVRISRQFNARQELARFDSIEHTQLRDANETRNIIVEFREEPCFLSAHISSIFKASSSQQFYLARFSQFAADADALRRSVPSLTAIQPRIRHEYYRAFFGVSLSAPASMMPLLQALPYVKSIHVDREVHATTDPAISQIGADSVWARFGTRGKGVRVGIIDSGIDYLHPALGGGLGSGFKVAGGYDLVNDDADPMDDNGHGTHVAGIIAADADSVEGVAPDATLYAYKALDMSGNGLESDVIAAIERAVDPDGNGDPSDRLDIVNLSLGTDGGSPTDPSSVAVDNATALGVLFCVAAGNTGGRTPVEGKEDNYFFDGSTTINSPGTAEEALTVGACDPLDAFAPFSSKGPNRVSFSIKPEVLAPGVNINSTYLGGTYRTMTGTSMSTPMVTGVAALIKNVHPDWRPAELKSAIVNTARDLGISAFRQGAGRVRALSGASAGTLVVPSTLGFGVDDPSTIQWQRAETLLVFNKRANIQSYVVGIAGEPPGMSLSVSPATFDLVPGDSLAVVVTITVNNAQLLNQPDDILRFSGTVALIGSADSASVPWAFVRTNRLVITTSEPNASFIGYSSTSAIQSSDKTVVWTSPTRAEVYGFSNGTYEFFTLFRNPAGTSKILLKEGVQLPSDATELSLNGAEAVFPLIYHGLDHLGRPLSAARSPKRTLITSLPNFGDLVTTLSGGSDTILVSAASQAHSFRPLEFQIDLARAGTMHIVQYDTIAGMNAGRTLTNAPADFLKENFVVKVPPGTARAAQITQLYNYRNIGGSGFLSGIGFGVDTMTVARDQISFASYWGKSPSLNQDVAANFYTSYTDFAHLSLDYQSAVIMPYKDSLVATAREFVSPATPRFESGSTMTFGGGPPHLLVVWLNNIIGTTTLHFRTLFRGMLDETRNSDIAAGNYSVFDENGTPLFTKSLAEPRQPRELSSGWYKVEITSSDYWLRNAQGRDTLTSAFNLTSGSNVIPPSLTSLTLLDGNGHTTDRFSHHETGTLTFAFNLIGFSGNTPSLFDSTKAWYRIHGTASWNPLSLTKVADVPDIEGTIVRADMSAATAEDSVAVDLRFASKDANGFSTDYIVSPAFAVGNWNGTDVTEVAAGGNADRSTKFVLEQNYPNPFNPSTTIRYTVGGVGNQASGVSEVRIVMYDLLGREVATIVNARQAPGTYEVRFDGSQLASGIYFYRLSAGGFTSVRKMTLVK